MDRNAWWYSWFGANEDIFHILYGKFVSTLDFLFPYLDTMGEYTNVWVYAGIALLITLTQYIYRKLNGYRYDAYYVRSQIAWLLAFVTAFFIMAAVVAFLKDFTSFPRPFSADNTVKLLYGSIAENNPKHSFPSGHAAFTAFLVAIFWSRSFTLIRLVLPLFLLLMLWYRVSTGAHYPADVFYGAMIGLIAVGISRRFWCKMFKVWR